MREQRRGVSLDETQFPITLEEIRATLDLEKQGD